MSICQNCATENEPAAAVCAACGRALGADPLGGVSQVDPTPTQPVRARTGRARQAPYLSPPGDTLPAEAVRRAAPRPQPGSSGTARRVGAYAVPPVQPAYTPPPVLPPVQARPAPRRDTTRLWRVFAGILVAGLLCAGVFAAWTIGATAINSVRRMSGGAVTLVPSPLDGLVGDLAPTQAPTAVEPTLAAAATDVPVVAATEVVATEVAATAAPVDWEQYLTPECSAAVDALRAANQRLTDNPAAPLDEGWRAELSAAVSAMKASCATVESASPVPGLVGEAHRNLDLATTEFDQANVLFAEGVKEVNPGKMLEAAQHIPPAVKYLNQALAELDKISQ